MSIISEYSNSTDQTQRNLDAQAARADLEWQRGFAACQFAKCAYANLPNEDQRQGWRAAERAAGEAMYTADAWTQHGVSYAERSIQ